LAQLYGDLWAYNFARIIVIDVSDDYRLMQSPMPSNFYPVLKEIWLPRHGLARKLADDALVTGYLYDWHETPESEVGKWYVGVVQQELTQETAP